MILSTTHENNYPFIDSCDLDLGTGNTLERGIIRNAKLYPTCDNADYAYISYIGRYPGNRNLDTEGLVVVSSNTGEELCTVRFDLQSTEGSIIGIAMQRDGSVCGCIDATRDLIAVLRGRYTPRTNSFIFTPSSFNPRPNTRGVYNLLSSDGVKLLNVGFDTDNGVFVSEGEDPRRPVYSVATAAAGEDSAEEIEATPSYEACIKQVNFKINGGTATVLTVPETRNIVLRGDKGCGLRIVPGDHRLTIGASRDV